MNADPRLVAVIAAHACPYSEVGGAENGGMSVYIRQVTEALARRGLRSVIFTRKEYHDAPAELDVPEGCHLVHVSAGPEMPLDKSGLFYHLPEFYRQVNQWSRDNSADFDLVQSHYWLSGWLGRRLGQLWGVPWAHMAHTLGRVKDLERPEGAARESDQRIAVEL
ncbi:MAG TPA: glycosyltransferase, partial [Candidatus Dormibacteraeota bacterium]|nr:glycosyltransferase [Candidatus Dormibacteraeota bacterium]